MADCGGICDIEISCSDGCGVVCTGECDDCTQWCEPTNVRSARIEGVMIRVNRKSGALRVVVGPQPELPDSAMPRYSEQEELRVRFHDLPRSSVARLLGTHLRRTVRVATGEEDERMSGFDEGTVAELAAKYSLVLD